MNPRLCQTATDRPIGLTCCKGPGALRHAEEAPTIQSEGIEVAYFDVSRAAAELGRETDALNHGARAYRISKRRIKVLGSASPKTLRSFSGKQTVVLTIQIGVVGTQAT